MFINVKKQFEAQGAIQTTEQVGVYNANSTHNFGFSKTGTNSTNKTFVQPSYIIYDYMPIIGGNRQMDNSYLITTVVNEFIRARASNTSLAKYDATDIAKWLIAAGGINVLVAEIKRGFKAYYLGKNSKRQMRQAGLQTVPAYWNTYSINGSTDIANLRLEFNRSLQKLAGIKIPKGVPFIDYWFKLSSKMFRENTLDKSANFYFRALAIPVWDVNGVYGTSGNIVYKNLSSSNNNQAPNDLTTMINLLGAIADIYTTDDTVNNMFAEFERANMTEVYELRELTEADLLTGLDFEVNLDVIYAVKNMKIVPMTRTDIGNITIEEGTSTTGGVMLTYSSVLQSGSFAFNPLADGGMNHYCLMDYYSGQYSEKIYSCHKDDMTDIDNINALQLSVCTESRNSTYALLRDAGLALVVGMFISTANINNDLKNSSYIQVNAMSGASTDDVVPTMQDDLLHELSIDAYTNTILQFTAIPTFYFMAGAAVLTPISGYLLDDSDNSIIISNAVTAKVFDAIVLSSVSYEK